MSATKTCIKNESVFWISLFLQAALVLCNNILERAEIEMKNIFGNGFETDPRNGKVYVWKIKANHEKVEPEDYSGGFRAFKSTETYLIFEKEWNINIFYWVGKETSLKQKKIVAKYAVMFYYLFCRGQVYREMRISLIREYETIESETFQYTLLKLKGTIPRRDDYSYLRDDGHFMLNCPNLYIVKGNETTSRVKKVTFSLRWIKPNICLMIQPGPFIDELHPSTIWCGKETSEKVRRRATEFVKQFNIASDFDVIIGVGTKYKILIESLEDDGNNRLSDVDTSSDDKIDEYEFINIRDKSVKIFELSNEYLGGREEKNIILFASTTLHRQTLVGKSFLLDTNSIAGVFFINDPDLGDVNAKIWAIQYVEGYLNRQIKALGRPILMRIISTQNHFQFDFSINILDRPVSLLPNNDRELW